MNPFHRSPDHSPEEAAASPFNPGFAQGCAKPSAKDPPSSSRREEADGYYKIVAVLNERWRVIECGGDLQWILQRRVGRRNGRARWRSDKYLRTKKALIRFVHVQAGEIDPVAQEVLENLPDWFGGEP
ncbi:hypothetical protein [Pseudohoeflea coraliihabitans]|uniref:Uncharacterized protein n=1 Tax=Pseudohoeflea coraliihabitans TaxID=2860393 RepID=A0ABS6WP40_9HYPH|nr:hypothetical protein [Pseudohoeflea sp. DP4N28-3]MBW3097729.1 hypothetical protein [Pseudohoeflea sp. DP4N28-3]